MHLTTRQVARKFGIKNTSPVLHLVKIGVLHDVGPARPGEKHRYPLFDRKEVKHVQKFFKLKAGASYYKNLIHAASDHAAPAVSAQVGPKTPRQRPQEAITAAHRPEVPPPTRGASGALSRLERIETKLNMLLDILS